MVLLAEPTTVQVSVSTLRDSASRCSRASSKADRLQISEIQSASDMFWRPANSDMADAKTSALSKVLPVPCVGYWRCNVVTDALLLLFLDSEIAMLMRVGLWRLEDIRYVVVDKFKFDVLFIVELLAVKAVTDEFIADELETNP